jgi:hypothetical protein
MSFMVYFLNMKINEIQRKKYAILPNRTLALKFSLNPQTEMIQTLRYTASHAQWPIDQDNSPFDG